MTLVLSNEDVESLLTMPECIAALESAYRELHAGDAVTRRRSDCMTSTGRDDGSVYGFKTMDGVVPGLGFSAVRLNSDIVTWPKVGNNRRRVKVPSAPGGRYVGLILLFSTANGEPLAMMPDGMVQRMRVGATNGLGAKCMAREDASDIGILGSGFQAVSQLQAICAVRKVKRIRCFSPSPENRTRFAAEMSEQLGVEVVPVSSTEDAIGGADVVMCSTNSIEAIFFQQWMEPGMHVSSIKMPEIDEAALKRADRVGLHFGHQSPDVVAARGVEAEDHRPGLGWQASRGFDFSKSPKLPEMLAGAAMGRKNDDEITCFINDLGLGLQFAAVAGVAWRKAKDAGVGHELPTDWFTETVHP